MHPILLALGYAVLALLAAGIATEAESVDSIGFQGWLGIVLATFTTFWGKLTHPTKVVGRNPDDSDTIKTWNLGS